VKKQWKIFAAIFHRGGGCYVEGSMKKIAIFDQYLALSRKSCKVRP